MSITGKTQLVGLLGYPVEHSLSPAMHNAAFRSLGLDWAYLPLPTPPWGLANALRGLAAMGFHGANVTIPHKEAVLSHLDDISPEARTLGAANTIVVRDSRLLGHNTDAHGFRAALSEARCSPRQAVVLGAGGAARAVVYALLDQGVKVTIANRSVERAHRLIQSLPNLAASAAACALTASALGPALAAADLLVNATPVGMWPRTEETPLPAGLDLPVGIAVMDLVYNPLETQLLRQARRSGASVVMDGLAMLVHQGAAAFRLWTGEEAPVGLMREAALKALDCK